MSSNQTETERDHMSATLHEDSDPPTSPKGVEDGCDDRKYNARHGGGFDRHSNSLVAGKNHGMGSGPKAPQNDELRSDMVDKPPLIEPSQSTPPRESGNETDDRRYGPGQPLATVESPGSASLKPDGPRPEPLKLKPLNSRLPSRRMRYTGPSPGVVRWEKDHKRSQFQCQLYTHTPDDLFLD
ncbi:hypothetical protein FMUND_15424 [Fusarium mundagurra]|uniref:Uncharacterized protein n=1 Tax=Fusarium mundagurra TaxID=1567541 RepID=A0A8H5XP28_9HYPO|nr:hypothetical protein FMUND_15424 [Fusarium mundagurra]